MAQGKRAKRAVIVSRRARHSRGSPGSFVRAKDALSQDDRGFSVGCLCWGRLKGSEPNARLLRRKGRDASRGSPGSFVRAKDALSRDTTKSFACSESFLSIVCGHSQICGHSCDGSLYVGSVRSAAGVGSACKLKAIAALSEGRRLRLIRARSGESSAGWRRHECFWLLQLWRRSTWTRHSWGILRQLMGCWGSTWGTAFLC